MSKRRKHAVARDEPIAGQSAIAGAPVQSPPNPATPLGFIPALDGIRGIAILAVMLHHFAAAGPLTTVIKRGPAMPLEMQLMYSGWLGVDIFFVLSGFLITRILIEMKSKPFYFPTFYYRRALRIFPPYYLFLGLMIFLTPMLPAIFDSAQPYRIWIWTYLTNFRMIAAGAESIPAPLQHFWSLAVEEQFYLIWPVVVYLCSPKQLKMACIAVIAASLAYKAHALFVNHDNMIHWSLFGRADQLALGALLGAISLTPNFLPRINQFLLPFIFSVVALNVLSQEFKTISEQMNPWVGLLSHPLIAAATFSAIGLAISVDQKNWMRSLLENTVLRTIGKYAYCLYIVHLPIAHLFRVWKVPSSIAATDADLAGLAIWQFGIPMVLSFGIAFISWHAFESKILKFKDKAPWSRGKLQLHNA